MGGVFARMWGSRLLAEVAAAAGVGEAFEEVVGARRQRRSAHAPGGCWPIWR
jgi:hypothetical protein